METPLNKPLSRSTLEGHVRASPYGSCLATNNDSFQEWRRQHLQPIDFPKEGFDHVYGEETIQRIDNTVLGGDEKQDDATEAAPSSFSEFGSTKSPADAPIGSLHESGGYFHTF